MTAVVLFCLAALMWTIRRAAGRLAPRVALVPLLFLISRTPVLVVWGLGSATMLFFVLRAAIARGHASFRELATLSSSPHGARGLRRSPSCASKASASSRSTPPAA